MATIRRFEEIEGWQTARRLTRMVYELSDEGPFARDYGLRDQMRRAAVSIMSNVAEGFESRTTALFIDYLGRAKGSCGELRAQLYVALDAGYIDRQQFDQLLQQTKICSRQLAAFMRYLQSLPENRRLRENQSNYEP